MKYAFLGNMNNMGYVFANAMKNRGYDVTLFIDAPPDYKLDRPEAMNPDIGNVYPEWILELKGGYKKLFPSTLKLLILPLLKKKYLRLLNSYDVIILNGAWIRLGQYIDKRKKVMNFFAGYDLDILADFDKIDYRIDHLIKKNRFLFFIKPLLHYILILIIKQQREGIRRADAVNYYPTGINPVSDKLLEEIKHGQNYKRLQLRGFPFSATGKAPFIKKEKFRILNFTRFFYTDFSRNDNKRNDIMINGISAFIHTNKIKPEEIQIIFFEKGQDIDSAKELCEQLNIGSFITWTKEVSQYEIDCLIKESDVVFDQLGNQWIGYGIVAMSIGRPVIANGRPEIFEPLTGEPSPVCQATTPEDVRKWLEILFYFPDKKQAIGDASSTYIRKHYDINKTVDFITSI